MRPKIGILGGIGPESSALFYQLLIEKAQLNELESNTDYPHIILESIPAPELLLEKPDLTMYKKGIKNLEKAGADFIVIVCNTAHVFIDEFKSLTNISIIDINKETENILRSNSVSDITIIGSKKTVNELFKFKNIKINALSNDESRNVDEIILEYNIGRNKGGLLKQVEKIMENHSRENILIACTELSTMLKSVSNQEYFDTFNILLDATYQKWEESVNV